MRKSVNILTLEQYQEAIQYGAGAIVSFDNFDLIEGTDAQDNPRYIVIEATDGTIVNYSDPEEEAAFYELSLEDFHQLCTYYLIGLQPGMEHSLTTFKSELNGIKKVAK